MAPYAIKRYEDGKFVAPPGSERSYTAKLQDAWLFDKRETAQSNCCGNESVFDVNELVRR